MGEGLICLRDASEGLIFLADASTYLCILHA
jgi:hypothetical protein